MNLETRAQLIHRKLTATFAPILLEVEDFSAQHSGHAGARPGGETHFRVKIISAAFAGLTKVAQHRAIYTVLAEDMQEGGIHALELDVGAEA